MASSLSQSLKDIGGADENVEEDLDDFLKGFECPLNSGEVRIHAGDALYSSLLINEGNTLQADIMYNNIVKSLSLVCWKEMDSALARSIDNFEFHKSGTIPALLDFSALTKLDVELEYVLISCLHQSVQRYPHVVTSFMLKSFADGLKQLSFQDLAVSSVLNQLCSSSETSNDAYLAQTLLNHINHNQFDSCVSTDDVSPTSNVWLMKFLFCIYLDQLHSAFEVVCDLLTEIHHLLPADVNSYPLMSRPIVTSSRGDDVSARDSMRLLHIASQLQLIVNAIEYSFYQASCSSFERHNRSYSRSDDKPQTAFEVSLMGFSDTHRYLIPLISVSVRTALIFSCLFVRPDLVQVLLSSESLLLLDSEYKEKYNQALSFRTDSSSSSGASGIDLSSLVVEGDDGFKYLQKLSRDHCNKLLASCKTGAFIIRPHETNANQYFVSFRGTDEEGVKHAIIRREDNPKSSNESDRYAYQCGKIGPCYSMMVLLTEISKILMNPLLFDSVVQYDVSVLLPHHSLDVNHALWTSVLPSLLPARLSSLSIDHYDPTRGASAEDRDEDDSSQSGDTAVSSDDCCSSDNDAPGLDVVGEGGVECGEEIEGDYVMLISSDSKKTAVGGGSDIKRSSRKRISGEDSGRKWNISKSSTVMSSMIEKLVSFLSIKEYLKQITQCTTGSTPGVIDLLYTQELLRHPEGIHESSKDGSYLVRQINSRLFASSTPQAMSEYIVTVSTGNVASETSDVGGQTGGGGSGAHTKYISICSLLLQAPIARFLIKSETVIQTLFMPPLPRLQHYLPPPYSYPEYDRSHEYLAGNYPNAPNPEGTLLAESLLKLAIKVMSSKYVKFPGYGNGYGGAEHIVENCLEIGEFSILLTKWRMLSMKYKEGGAESVEDLGGFTKTGSTGQLDRVENASSVTSGKASIGGIGKNLSNSSLVKLSTNIKKISNQLHLPGSVGSAGNNGSGGNTPVGSAQSKPFVVDAIYQDTTQQIVDILYRVNTYLQIPSSCTTAYAQTICSWLVQMGALHQVTKLADHAFALPTTYYKYIDPWEVRALHDYSLASERVRLGRNQYGVCTTMVNYNNAKNTPASSGANEGSGEMSPAPARSERPDPLSGSVNSGKTAPANTASGLIASILHYAHVFTDNLRQSCGLTKGDSKFRRSKEFRLAVHKLWELLSAEMYLVSLFSSALPQPERETVHSAVAANPELATNQVQSNYQSTLWKFMYRNALYSRMAFPHRYVPNIQVDIYSIKEVIGVSSKTTSGPVKVPLGPGSVSASINSATLTPSTATHGSSVELFATIRLTRDSAKRVDVSQLTSNKTVHVDGTVISGSHKADSNRSGGNTVNTTSTIYRRNTAHSTQTMNTITSISNSIDYVWREQAIFRHALPEGLLYPSLPRPNVCDPGVSCPGVIPAVNLPLYAPPNKIVITVYERSFFSDHKLGEVEINLSELTDKKVIRDWFPLINSDKCISWLIYLQIKVKFQLMTVEMTTAPHSSSRSPSKEKSFYYKESGEGAGGSNQDSRSSSVNSVDGGSAGGAVGGTKGKGSFRSKKTSFLSHLDDFF